MARYALDWCTTLRSACTGVKNQCFPSFRITLWARSSSSGNTQNRAVFWSFVFSIVYIGDAPCRIWFAMVRRRCLDEIWSHRAPTPFSCTYFSLNTA